MQHIRFISDGLTLKGTLYKPQKMLPKNKALLFLHGWKSRQQTESHYAQVMAKNGFIVLTYDMRGHGDSDGVQEELTRTDFLNDAISAYDYLVSIPGVDREHITIAGSSMGSYIAALLTSKRSVKNLILRVPANYPDKGFDTQTLMDYTNSAIRVSWRTTPLMYTDSIVLQAIHSFSGNILIVESENDKLVPHQTIENYMNAVSDKAQLTHVLMKGADHSISRDINRVDEYAEIIKKWIMLKIK